MNALAPSAMHWARSASSADEVNTTTEMPESDRFALIAARTSNPPIFGKFRLQRIRPGRGASANRPDRCKKSIASRPSVARYSVAGPSVSRKAISKRQYAASLSSTLSTTRLASLDMERPTCVPQFSSEPQRVRSELSIPQNYKHYGRSTFLAEKSLCVLPGF
jgi:hypothetical protein